MPSKKAIHTINVSGHEVIVKKSARRKTMAIKVNNDGVFLHIPDILPIEIATAFVEKKASWIEKKLQFTRQQADLNQFNDGDMLLFLGEQYRIQIQTQAEIKKPSITLQGKHALLTNATTALSSEVRYKIIKQWYRQQANDYLIQRSLELSHHCRLKANSFQVRTYKARWGSCSHDGHIRYNWKIIQAPKAVIDYLIIHELCHIQEHNHSAAFWALVSRYCPDYKRQRQWLKTYGHRINI